jgi:hypothetical protein
LKKDCARAAMNRSLRGAPISIAGSGRALTNSRVAGLLFR